LLTIVTISLIWHYKKDKLIILCMGDSLTANGYPYWLQKKVRENNIKATVINRGINGHTSGEYLHYLKRSNSLKEIDPDIVLLQLGTNDIRIDADHTPTDHFIKNMNQIIMEISLYHHSKGKKLKILISTITPINDIRHISTFNHESIRRVKDEINPAIEEIAKRWRLILVDNYRLFLDHMDLVPDVHLSEEGYMRMAENWFKYLKMAI